ncbi:sensor histidine kinase [Desulfatiglans anilini]|uniref:sensor histidine kinase n=1 Tax=Desulfatiglans anilini TaxID=90728 RepID=UPI000402FF36|nr:sensor histidine kinase [Desulfatiglans anilini]
MFKGWFISLIVMGNLTALFLVAYYAERRERKGKSLVANPYVYSLSLAVYCTSWTFYGSVGEAATSGLSFLPVYLGPTLMSCLWGVLLIKIIVIAKRHRITTISDFLSSRYGNSLFISILVTLVSLIGITPYLGLQMKAILNAFTILAGESRGITATGWVITLVLGVFAVIFGARRLDSSERHGGLVLAIAFESLVKLVAFLGVGIFVTYGLFDGFGEIFSRIQASDQGHLMTIGEGSTVSYLEWSSLLFLSMMAVLFLPRQFQMAVVENADPSHVYKAMWLFPLYLLLMNIFVLPIAFGGILLGRHQAEADTFVLTIPLTQGSPALALLVLIGGFSAASGMIIVESLALSTMVMNSLVMPAIFRFRQIRGFPALILNIKRFIIIGCVFLGYFFAVFIGRFYTLVQIGLKSFEAVTIFAPAFILGLYWKKGNKKGAIAGILAGFGVWTYTLLLPALIRAHVLPDEWGAQSLMQNVFLSPRALFGLEGLDKWSHSLFWGLLFNVVAYIGVSLATAKRGEEERQALLFVEAYDPALVSPKSLYSIEQIEAILEQYIGRQEASDVIGRFMARHGIERGAISRDDLIRLRDEAKRILSGALGSSMAAILFEDKSILTEKERDELSSSVKMMTDTLRLSRHELSEANRNLAYLKAFSENIIESAPFGIVAVDAHLHVTYWNREMETLTVIPKAAAIGRPVQPLIPWIPEETWTLGKQQERTVESPALQHIKINISPFKDPSGGLVAIFENITQKKIMEKQLLQTSKLASLGKLTAGISHEIGNPLASISSLVQELQSLELRSDQDVAFTQESLNNINGHLARISKIVRSLGDFARLSSSEKVPTDIPGLVEQTVNLLKYDKRSRKVEFVTRMGKIPQLRVNPDQIQQVFLNLMLNAVDAMPEGGRLEVSIEDKDRWIDIRFRDTGSGIDESLIDRIFDPFFSTKPMGKGTGLGLSICYGIIKEHNGSISVRSSKGNGTSFEIRLPKEEASHG